MLPSLTDVVASERCRLPRGGVNKSSSADSICVTSAPDPGTKSTNPVTLVFYLHVNINPVLAVKCFAIRIIFLNWEKSLMENS